MKWIIFILLKKATLSKQSLSIKRMKTTGQLEINVGKFSGKYTFKRDKSSAMLTTRKEIL